MVAYQLPYRLSPQQQFGYIVVSSNKAGIFHSMYKGKMFVECKNHNRPKIKIYTYAPDRITVSPITGELLEEYNRRKQNWVVEREQEIVNQTSGLGVRYALTWEEALNINLEALGSERQ